MNIQEATIEEAPLVLEYIKKKAEFDGEIRGEPCIVSTTLEKIEQTMFCANPYAKVIFAKNIDTGVLGFALYHTRYSSFSGIPSLWLDDLYVNPDIRSKGIGLEIMGHLESVGKKLGASHIAWNASADNTRGQKFYNRLGAQVERTEGKLLYYRYTVEQG